MQNLSTIGRFEHIEPGESVGSTTYSQYRTFVVFVQVPHDEDTALNETHLEQWARIGPALPEIIAFYSGHSIIETSASTTSGQ